VDICVENEVCQSMHLNRNRDVVNMRYLVIHAVYLTEVPSQTLCLYVAGLDPDRKNPTSWPVSFVVDTDDMLPL